MKEDATMICKVLDDYVNDLNNIRLYLEDHI
jgi:hypothetical protein